MELTQIATLAIAGGGLASGGVAAIRVFFDHREGVDSHEIQEQDISTKTFMAAISTQKGLIDTLEATVKAQQATISELSTQVTGFKEQLTSASARIEALEASLAVAQDAVTSLTGIKEVLLAHIETLNTHIHEQLPPPPPQLPAGI